MEILYVKNDGLMISLSGDALNFDKRTIGIECGKSISHCKKVILCTDTEYRLTFFNKTKAKLNVRVNGERTAVRYIMGEKTSGYATVLFNKSGRNTIEILQGKNHRIVLTADVCPGMADYKMHFADMKNRIGEITSGKVPQLTGKDIEKLYAFYCFAELNNILSELYLPVSNKATDEIADIHKDRTLRYINTKNDNEIVLAYKPKRDGLKIFISIIRKNKITTARRLYGFDALYKDGTEEEDNRAYAYRCTVKGKKSDLPALCGVYMLCFGKTDDKYKNLFTFSPYENNKLKEWVISVGGDKDINEYPPLEDVLLENASKEEFDRRDVMVAVVKTKSQFNTNIKDKFYYIPAHFIEENRDIKYIALYQSKTLFGSEAGIKYFGEVDKMSLVPRYKISEIPLNSQEPYYRFDIKRWQILEEKIKPKDFAEVCMFTNMLLLKSAKEVPRLYTGSFTEYVLHRVFEKIKDDKEINFMLFDTYFKCDSKSATMYLKNGERIKISRTKENLCHVAYEIDKVLKSGPTV